MSQRVRHCIECPKCRTRYLLGFSPYGNGSYIVPLFPKSSLEWILYCSCAKLPVSSRWSCKELNRYAVSRQAYGRGYGSADEIVTLMGSLRAASAVEQTTTDGHSGSRELN
jgi:hypothetical protein